MSTEELNFMQFLQTFQRGELLDDCNQKLNDLVEGLTSTGKNGAMTLKLDFKHNKAGQLEITPAVSIKKPSRDVRSGVYFVSDDNRLTRRDPRQMDMMDEIERRRFAD